MTTSDIRPTDTGPALGSAVARWLASAAALMGLEAVWFGCRFIVPRYEAHLMDLGRRPSPGVGALLVASSYVARYFWWMAPILVVVFAYSANSRARGLVEKCPLVP